MSFDERCSRSLILFNLARGRLGLDKPTEPRVGPFERKRLLRNTYLHPSRLSFHDRNEVSTRSLEMEDRRKFLF